MKHPPTDKQIVQTNRFEPVFDVSDARMATNRSVYFHQQNYNTYYLTHCERFLTLYCGFMTGYIDGHVGKDTKPASISPTQWVSEL